MANRRGVGRTRYEWTSAFGEQAGLAAGALVGFLLATATQAETVMRVRGEIIGALDLAGSAANDAAAIAWGIMVMPAGAVAGGVTVGPSANGEADWMAYGFHPVRSDSAIVATDANKLGLNVFRTTVDSKAMRRMREGEQLVLVAENATLVGAPAINFGFGLRILSGE